MIAQLIFVASARLQAGVLRHVHDLPVAWVERLRQHDPRRGLITSLKVEGWVWIHLDEASLPTLGAAKRWEYGPLAAVRRPYLALCLADVSETWRRGVDRLERIGPLCDRDLRAEGAHMDLEVPRWNRVGKLLAPNLGGAIDRLARLELDRELLLLEAEADATRRATGAWPVAGSFERSAACPGDRWVYTASADGLEIALSREVQWPDQLGAILPQRIVLD